jgi:Na+-translocating ferredoxin:NAD+ oxidoreductase subunit G
MSYFLKLGAILFLIAAIATTVLAFVNGITAPMIAENQRRTEEEARREVLPDAVRFVFVDGEPSFHIGINNEEGIAGYTFIAEGNGYSGVIQTMVGVDKGFEIELIKIISQTETPGLGANCVRSEFTDQFSGKTYENLALDRDGGQIVTITGATITTRAITNSMTRAIAAVRERVANEEFELTREEESQEVAS